MSKNLSQAYDFEYIFEDKELSGSKPLKILYRLYQGNFIKISLSIFFFLLKSLPVWVMPIVLGNIINIATNPEQHSERTMWINIIVMIVLVLQNIPTHALFVSFMSKAIRYVEAGLRATLIRKTQRMTMSFHGEFQAGRIQAKVLRDVEAIEFLSKQMMVALIPAVISMIVAIGTVLYHSLTVAGFFILTIPAAMAIVSGFRKRIRASNRAFRKEIESMSGQVSEMVEMIPVTRAHGLEKVEIRKIDSAVKNIQGKGYRLDILEAFFSSSNWATFQIFQVLCLVFTGTLAYRGLIPVGHIATYQLYFNMILMQVSQILNVYPQIMKGFESIDSITEILLSRDTEDYQGKKKLEPLQGKVSFENLHFHYRDSSKHVITDLALEVKPGETIAFVGESGAGKSTILNLMIGFYKPTQGRILIDDVPMEELNIGKYRNNLAVVLQNNILFSGTIRDNITYGLPSISEDKLWEVIEMANLKHVIEELPEGLDTKIGEHGGKMSGGQRQRIAIARALVRDPKIIILDEATSALDNVSEHHVQSAMKRLIEGRTTFIVAHRLTTIRDADRIVVMKNGRAVESGTYEELLAKRGEFYELKEIQSDVMS